MRHEVGAPPLPPGAEKGWGGGLVGVLALLGGSGVPVGTEAERWAHAGFPRRWEEGEREV